MVSEERANSNTKTSAKINSKTKTKGQNPKFHQERFRGGSVGGRWLRKRGEIQIQRQVQRQKQIHRPRIKFEILSEEV